jgi:hypothetical protein
MLGAAVVAGGLGLGAATAQAAEFGIYARGPVAYIPPCPGPGYVWIAGYEANGYWIPGRWNFAGFGDRDRFERVDRDQHFDRDRSRDFARRSDRDHDQRRDFDRDRDGNSGRDRLRR